jgi:hypothetical protein
MPVKKGKGGPIPQKKMPFTEVAENIGRRENPSDESNIDRVWQSSITGTLSCLL